MANDQMPLDLQEQLRSSSYDVLPFGSPDAGTTNRLSFDRYINNPYVVLLGGVIPCKVGAAVICDNDHLNDAIENLGNYVPNAKNLLKQAGFTEGSFVVSLQMLEGGYYIDIPLDDLLAGKSTIVQSVVEWLAIGIGGEISYYGRYEDYLANTEEQ